MAYADQDANGNRITALIVVALIHIVVGYTLVSGLAYSAASEVIKRVTTVDIEEEEPDEPDEPEEPPEPQEIVPPPPVAPQVEVPLSNTQTITVTDQVNDDQTVYEEPDRGEEEQTRTCPAGGGQVLASQACPPTQTCDDGSVILASQTCTVRTEVCWDGQSRPVGTCPDRPPPPPKLEPRNSPGGWITQNDYKPSWVRREYAGTVSFALQVGENGRASSCSVRGGSAPQALKDAACRLIQRRARFNRGASGQYTGTVRWQLPPE